MKYLQRLTSYIGCRVRDLRAGRRFGTPCSMQPSMRDVFFDIFHRRAWGDCESISGPGSGLERTSGFRNELMALLREIDTRTVLDAACGDFNWMRMLPLTHLEYIGVDVVPELIQRNREQYAHPNRQFLCLDITRDVLPRADVILCRDCLVHFSYEAVFAAFRNFKRSGARYLLASTFIKFGPNEDIITGEWRPLNLRIEPFNFPAPLKLIDEKCSHSGGIYSDKSLGLWEFDKTEVE